MIDPENPSYGDEKVQRWSDQATWIVSEAVVHEPLVTQEVFQAAQRRFVVREMQSSPKARVGKHDCVLKSRILCGGCERRIEGSRSSRANYLSGPDTGRSCTPDDDRPPTHALHARGGPHPRRGQLDPDGLRASNLDRTINGLRTAVVAPDLAATRSSLLAEVRACETEIMRCKAALRASNEPLESIVAWNKEVEVRRARPEQQLARLQPRARLGSDQLKILVAAIPSPSRVESPAEPRRARRASTSPWTCALRYVPGEGAVRLTANLAGACGTRTCPRGDLNPLTA